MLRRQVQKGHFRGATGIQQLQPEASHQAQEPARPPAGSNRLSRRFRHQGNRSMRIRRRSPQSSWVRSTAKCIVFVTFLTFRHRGQQEKYKSGSGPDILRPHSQLQQGRAHRLRIDGGALETVFCRHFQRVRPGGLVAHLFEPSELAAPVRAGHVAKPPPETSMRRTACSQSI